MTLPTITLQQGTFGEVIRIATGRDLSDVAALRIVLTPSGGTPIVHDHDDTIIVDPAAGEIDVPLQPGDLDIVGEYEIQWADITPGRYIPGTPGVLVIEANAPGMAAP